MTTTERSFEFINYKSPKSHDGNASLSKVRRHVMKDYFWKQSHYDRSKTRGQSVVDCKYAPTQSGTPKAWICKSKPRKHDKADQLRRLLPPNEHHACPGLKNDTSVAVSQKEMCPQHRSARVTSRPSLFDELGHPSLDPFNVLPIPGGYEMEDLIRWYFVKTAPQVDIKVPWLHQLNSSWQLSLWDMAREDVAMLHNILSIAELRKQSLTGRTNNAAYFFHLGQAINAIKDNITEVPRKGLSKALSVLVSTQVSRSLAEKDYATARMHMQALRNAYIGDPRWQSDNKSQFSFLTMDSISFLYVLINDFRLASITCEDPIIPFQDSRIAKNAPSQFVIEAARRTLTTIIYFPTGMEVGAAYEMVNEVQQMSLLLDETYSQSLTIQFTLEFSSRAQSRLCRLAASCRCAANRRDLGIIKPLEAVTFCALMFLRDCLPDEMPTKQSISGNIKSTLAGRICRGLFFASDLCTLWIDSESPLESLLWVLFLGTLVSSEYELHYLPWYLRELKAITTHLGIGNLAELESTMKLFPWTSKQFGQQFVHIGGLIGMDDTVERTNTTYRIQASIY